MIVEFTQAHNYGGVRFEKGDFLDCPDDRAKMLIDAKVAKKPAAKKAKADESS